MIVDGQVYGGAAQGIGTALYEEMPFDEQGQPLATTLADYLLPGSTEVPSIRLDHIETPSPNTFFGQKGIGEGGAIAPPAAIANAVNDALAPLGRRDHRFAAHAAPHRRSHHEGARMKACLVRLRESARRRRGREASRRRRRRTRWPWPARNRSGRC